MSHKLILGVSDAASPAPVPYSLVGGVMDELFLVVMVVTAAERSFCFYGTGEYS